MTDTFDQITAECDEPPLLYATVLAALQQLSDTGRTTQDIGLVAWAQLDTDERAAALPALLECYTRSVCTEFAQLARAEVDLAECVPAGQRLAYAATIAALRGDMPACGVLLGAHEPSVPLVGLQYAVALAADAHRRAARVTGASVESIIAQLQVALAEVEN